jgi:hypothetical protein
MPRTPTRIQQYVKDHGRLVALVAAFILIVCTGVLFWKWTGVYTVDEAGVITVLDRVEGGVHHRRRFVHRVRTADGTQYLMTFSEVYPVGSKLWVQYRRLTHGQRTKVSVYWLIRE